MLGLLVVAAELVGQAGVRVGADRQPGDPRQVGDVAAQLPRAQRAVEADRDRPGVHDRGPERLDGLARQRPAGCVGDRPRDDQRDAVAGRVVGGLDAEDRGLRVERVEDRLDDEEVGAALDEALGRLLVRLRELVERDVPGARVVDLRARSRPSGWSGRARPSRSAAGPGRRPRRASAACAGEPRRLAVHLADERRSGRSRPARCALAVKVLVSMMSAPASR